MIENVHSEVYSIFIESLIKDPQEKKETFEAAHTNSCVKRKTEWAQRYIESQSSFSTRLLAFACVEGIFFSASFCAIFYMKKQGLMPGLSFSNELIARDEGMHRDFACLLLRERAADPSKETLTLETALEVVREAVEIEKEFVRDALRVDLLGMNADLMQEYVEFCADHLLSNVVAFDKAKGVHRTAGPMYHARNPFDWMESISLTGKTNFFEKRVSEYQKSNVARSTDKASNFDIFKFTQTEDF
ncbi:hypothetical protein CYMTET_54262 [Cymbomonas tetramitiformis]|uniref:Uncharacterized protein n=1 Tax=Cymbomonas tetramitiformis TaxID=36881 RepID=A0AAE0EQX4_9CHLO|nr:hypothetical protein CYMTET_54262 [Cymbomonas tetramitiformis]